MTMRLSRFPSLGRRLAFWLVALSLGAGAWGPSWAGGERGRGGRAMTMRAPSFAARPARQVAAPRPPPVREAATPQPGPIERPVDRPSEPSIERPGKPGKLTPDERRALRQQINDAGRDIYRAPRP